MKENINDIIRNKISKKFYSKNSEEFDQKIDEFFCEVMNNKKDGYKCNLFNIFYDKLFNL